MKKCFIPRRFSAEKIKIIDKANEIVADYARQGFNLTLRQLYYQFISANVFANTIESYKNLGATINDARWAGLVDWEALEDRGRETVTPRYWPGCESIINASARQFQIDRWHNQPVHIEVIVEKQALEGILIPVCEDEMVAFTANKGYASASLMYEMAERLRHKLQENKHIVILYCGDHDPSGIDMVQDVDYRLKLLTGFTVLEGGEPEETGDYEGDFEVERIALNMDQVQRYSLPPNPAKTTDGRAKKYIEKYGVESWELDAMSPSVLASLVRDEILQRRDDDRWDKAVETEEKHKATLRDFISQARISDRRIWDEEDHL